MEARTEDMGEILQAIRDVEARLATRAERARGALMILWGTVVAAIFLFYQLVRWNPAPYVDLFGPFLLWVWTVPTLAGYALTVALGLRVGRLLPKGTGARWWSWTLASLLPVAVLIALLLLGEGRRAPGLWIVFLGAMALWGCFSMTGVPRAAGFVVGGGALLGGLLLFAFPQSWGDLAAAGFYGLGLVGLGTVVATQGG